MAHYVTKDHDNYPHAACEVCGRQPAAWQVRWWSARPESGTVERVESHYFCTAHADWADEYQRHLEAFGPVRDD
jgi:hypothetical protein